jgi:hypothetical protein
MEGSSEEGRVWVSAQDVALIEASGRVMQAGIHLALNGYGRMGLLPYIGGAGWWRCEFHVLGHPERVLYRYSFSSVTRFLENHAGGSVRRDILPEKLGQAIMVSVPEHLREQCRGEVDAGYREWLLSLRASLHRLPRVVLAFHEYSEDKSRWEIRTIGKLDARGEMVAPPPGYVLPGDEPPAGEHPFWRERLEAWRLLALKPSLTVPIGSLDDHPALGEIAGRLCQELQGCTVEDAGEPFLRAFKAAMVALRVIDPNRLLWALREAGIEPLLVQVEEDQQVVGMGLAGVEKELSLEDFKAERTARVALACVILGLPFDEAEGQIAEMCSGSLVQAMLLERQQGKFAAQTLTATAIKKAKRG